jgi:hypothetical protein
MLQEVGEIDPMSPPCSSALNLNPYCNHDKFLLQAKKKLRKKRKICYRAFHGFGQAKFPDSGSDLGSSQFSILPQLPLKTTLGVKMIKIVSKKSNWLC